MSQGSIIYCARFLWCLLIECLQTASQQPYWHPTLFPGSSSSCLLLLGMGRRGPWERGWLASPSNCTVVMLVSHTNPVVVELSLLFYYFCCSLKLLAMQAKMLCMYIDTPPPERSIHPTLPVGPALLCTRIFTWHFEMLWRQLCTMVCIRSISARWYASVCI